MASKRQVRRSECGDKRRYGSNTEAQCAAFLVSRQVGAQFDAYRCK